MPNPRYPIGLLNLLAASAQPASGRDTAVQSKTAPRPPGSVQTDSERFKPGRGSRRNPNFDYPDEPTFLPYISQAERDRFRRRPLTEQLGSMVVRNGRTYFDPGRRVSPAVEQAQRLRRQFDRSEPNAGVDRGLQARVANAVDDPEALAFLDVLGLAEGGRAWRERGGAQWNSRFDDRPGRRLTFGFERFPEAGPGRFQGDPQTAAGRYQIQAPLYREIAPQLGISDFSPQSQNAIALGTMAERWGMLDSLQRGDLAQAFSDAARYWASIPQGPEAGADRNQGRYDKTGQHPPFTYDQLLAHYKQRLTYYEGGDPNGRVSEEPVAIRR